MYQHLQILMVLKFVRLLKIYFLWLLELLQDLNKTKPKDNLYLNTSAALIKQSVYEMEVFTEFLKGKKETVKGLAGLGDLYVSAAGGRNSKMGAFIGEGIFFLKQKKQKCLTLQLKELN